MHARTKERHKDARQHTSVQNRGSCALDKAGAAVRRTGRCTVVNGRCVEGVGRGVLASLPDSLRSLAPGSRCFLKQTAANGRQRCALHWQTGESGGGHACGNSGRGQTPSGWGPSARGTGERTAAEASDERFWHGGYESAKRKARWPQRNARHGTARGVRCPAGSIKRNCEQPLPNVRRRGV